MECLDYEMSLALRPSKSRFNRRTRQEPPRERYTLSDYTGPRRQYLPEVLARVTHDGNGRNILPTSPISRDGKMHPRRPLGDPTRQPHPDHILHHLNAYNRTPTSFLSFGTWRCVSSRIASWEELGVRNMRLHLIQTSFLPYATKVFKSSEWAARYSPQGAKPYLDGEFLIEGHIPAYSFLISGIPVQGIPTYPEGVAMKWMQWGEHGLDGVWRNNGHAALRDLLEGMFLAERKGSYAPRLSTTAESVSALLRFLTAEDAPRIDLKRRLRQS